MSARGALGKEKLRGSCENLEQLPREVEGTRMIAVDNGPRERCSKACYSPCQLQFAWVHLGHCNVARFHTLAHARGQIQAFESPRSHFSYEAFSTFRSGC